MAFTYFFRDEQMLNLALDHVVPTFSARRVLDVWDAGCATGPEPYTLAILFRQRVGPFLFRNLRIHATDVDLNNTFGEVVQRGVYPAEQLARIPEHLLASNFQACDEPGSLQLVDIVRSRVSFHRHDLLTLEPIGSRFSLIVCKNVLLHFSEDQRCAVLRMFHASLDEGGYLVMEHTQKLPASLDHLFTRVTGEGRLYRKVDGG